MMRALHGNTPAALPPLRLGNLNMAGVKGDTRLRQAFAAAQRERLDIFFGQEHGLHADDEERLERTAREFGFRVEASFIDEDRTRGGTWVAVRRDTFRLTWEEPIPRNSVTLGGGVTSVRVPTDRVGGTEPLSCVSLYVPVHARLRKVFLERLRKTRLLTRGSIVGADRNTVRDISLDVRYQDKFPKSYAPQNRYATLFDTLMADHGLEDVFRQLEGKHARSYTHLGKTVHTRIDCIFGPKKSESYQWYSYNTQDIHGATWQSDHLAVVVEMKQVTEHNIAKGRCKEAYNGSVEV